MTDCNHCAGLSRSRLLHRAAAEAGRGLPAIEHGMPLPAGTGLSRRSFLAQSAGAMLAVYGSSKLGLRALDAGIAAAATGPAQPVLISVFLEGGADALSVLSPQGDPLYKKLRPHLALSGGPAFSEDDRLRWHPAAAALAGSPGGGSGETAASTPTAEGGSPLWHARRRTNPKAGLRRSIAGTIPQRCAGGITLL